MKNNSIKNKYRPDWTSDKKPEYNCAQVLFNDKDQIFPGEKHIVLLQPLKYEFWSDIEVYDILRCMEGKVEVGTATVLEIIKD